MSHLCFVSRHGVSKLPRRVSRNYRLFELLASLFHRPRGVYRAELYILSGSESASFFFSMEHEYGVKDIPSNLRLREEFSSQPAPQNWQNEEDCALQAQQEIQDRAEP